MNVWGPCEKMFQKSTSNGHDFMRIAKEMLNKCTVEEFEFFVVLSQKFGLKKIQ